MADPLSPDAIAHRTFGQRLRGYNPDEVGAFLEEVSLVVQDLKAEGDALHARLLELGNRDLTAEFDLISQDVGRILQDARETAEGMRSRAAADAEAIIEEATAAATDLRSDSWMASDKLLQDSAKEAAAIVQAAERDSLVITSEAEREAHHRQTAVRQESEETVRAAKLEAERVLMDARARSDELIVDATRKVEAAEGRAAALEERRAEMLADLEDARQTISSLEGEIEKRREALAGPSPEEFESSTVKLLTGPVRETDQGEDATVWAEGHEVVKIVRPPKRIVEPPPEPVDAEAMAAEVARLRLPSKGDTAPVVSSPEEQPPTEPPADELAQPIEPDAAEDPAQPIEPALSEEPAQTQEPVVGSAPVVMSESPASPIDDLFARLRRVEQEIPTPEPVEAVVYDQQQDSEPVLRDVSHPGGPGDPFDLRDRLLLPVTNRILRAVKRELTEAQNIALEELRIEEGNWKPDPATLTQRLVETVEELLAESYSAGWAAAAETTGSDLVPDGDREGDPGLWAGRFAEALTSAVSDSLGEARGDGRGPRQLAASLSRVFRSWRTDEAERRVRDIASGAYHRGLMDGWQASGLTAGRWLVAGRGCTVCREAAEAGAVGFGSVFENSVTEPPAHNDCGCSLTPA